MVLRSLVSTYPISLGAGLPVAFLLYGALYGIGENGYRYAGLALQIAGLATVVFGIGKTRAEFGEGWSKALARWLQSLAIAVGLKKPSVKAADVAGLFPGITSRGEATVGLPPGATIEQRVALHDRLIDGLRMRMEVGDRNLEKERQERTRAIDSEQVSRQSGDDQIKDLVKRLAMGGVDLSLLGTFWIGFGIIFATAPQELALWTRI